MLSDEPPDRPLDEPLKLTEDGLPNAPPTIMGISSSVGRGGGVRVPSAERIAAAMAVIDPVFLHSPLLRGSALDRVLGAELVLKVETLNPLCGGNVTTADARDWLLG